MTFEAEDEEGCIECGSTDDLVKHPNYDDDCCRSCAIQLLEEKIEDCRQEIAELKKEDPTKTQKQKEVEEAAHNFIHNQFSEE